MEEKTVLVCPNKVCGKVFAKPLKTIKLHQGSKEQYDACPFCLTEITITEIECKNPPEKKTIKAPLAPSKDETIKKDRKAFGCKYHLGYLSEKENRQQISEECMVCKELIECMHKKIAT